LDRPRTRLVLSIGLTLAALATAGAAASFPLHAGRWVAEGFDPAKVLSERPAECLSQAADKEQAYKIELGRAAFRTPLLLGGQAARAGLSCDSCHRNGHNNPSFFFPGLSGKPGTADVTSSLFSSHRGDGVANPLPIRDLSATSDKLVILRNRQNPNLRNFIHGQITEEFNGAEPPPAVMDGLAAYVRALDPAVCPVTAQQPVTVRSVMGEAVRAVRAADAALAHKDGEAAILMLASARTQLGLVHERFMAPDLAREREAIEASDLGLSALQAGIRGRKKDLSADLAIWQAEAKRLTERLETSQSRSLFDPVRLAEAGR
jgi:hypothetical protein